MVPRGPEVNEEIKWRAYMVFGALSHCRAVARLSAEERAEVEAVLGCALADTAETGRALLELSETELVALAEQIDNPWDHQAIRRAAAMLRRDGITRVHSMALRAALLRRVRYDPKAN